MTQTRAQIAAQKKEPASTVLPLTLTGGRYRVAKSPQKSARSSHKPRTGGRAVPPKHAQALDSSAQKRTARQENPDAVQRRSQKRTRATEDPPEHIPDDRSRKRRHVSIEPPEKPSGREAVGDGADDPIGFWVAEGRWPPRGPPPEYSEQDAMAHLLARKKSSPSLRRKQSDSGLSSTPSDQKPREEKSAPYRNPQYELLLQTKGAYMNKSELDVTASSKDLCHRLLDGEHATPHKTLFDDDIFENACRNLQGKNEARVIQDISRLIVPSAETLALRVKSLECLVESVNEGWNNSIPLAGTRPQPDYSIGFRREAFTQDQLDKISPFLGDYLFGDQSFFMATYYMLFPFLADEVKCGAQALEIADRQNAHSMTLAVRAVVELFRLVGRESEVHREILAFSISHDHQSVRIYGHYPVIDGKDTKYYRHPIYKFDFTTLDGKEKWTAYRFTRNVYDQWMPNHLKRLCSVIDQIPSNIDFGVSAGDSSTPVANAADGSEPATSQEITASAPSSQNPVPFKKPKLPTKVTLEKENERLRQEKDQGNQRTMELIELLKQQTSSNERLKLEMDQSKLEMDQEREQSKRAMDELKDQIKELMGMLKQKWS